MRRATGLRNNEVWRAENDWSIRHIDFKLSTGLRVVHCRHLHANWRFTGPEQVRTVKNCLPPELANFVVGSKILLPNVASQSAMNNTQIKQQVHRPSRSSRALSGLNTARPIRATNKVVKADGSAWKNTQQTKMLRLLSDVRKVWDLKWQTNRNFIEVERRRTFKFANHTTCRNSSVIRKNGGTTWFVTLGFSCEALIWRNGTTPRGSHCLSFWTKLAWRKKKRFGWHLTLMQTFWLQAAARRCLRHRLGFRKRKVESNDCLSAKRMLTPLGATWCKTSTTISPRPNREPEPIIVTPSVLGSCAWSSQYECTYLVWSSSGAQGRLKSECWVFQGISPQQTSFFSLSANPHVYCNNGNIKVAYSKLRCAVVVKSRHQCQV